MDIPAFAVTALSRANCPQPQKTFLRDFLDSQGEICAKCPLFVGGQCPGFNKVLTTPLDEFSTLEALHNGNLDLIVVFDFLSSHNELIRLSHQSVTMAITLTCYNGSESPLTDEELLAHLRQHFHSDTTSEGIDMTRLQKTIRLMAEELEGILKIRIPQTTN